MTSHCAGWGNAYAQIILDGGGRVRELWPLRPDRMAVERKAGVVQYTYQQQNGQEVTLAAWQVHHRRAMVLDGLTGSARRAWRCWPWRWGWRPRSSAPGSLRRVRVGVPVEPSGHTDGQSLRAPQGDAGRVDAGERGQDAHHRGRDEGRADRHSARGSAIPGDTALPGAGGGPVAPGERPHKIGLLENATFSNIEHQAIEFVTDTIRPWLICNEQAMYRSALPDSEQAAIYFEYLRTGCCVATRPAATSPMRWRAVGLAVGQRHPPHGEYAADRRGRRRLFAAAEYVAGGDVWRPAGGTGD